MDLNMNNVFPTGASDVGDPAVGGVLNRYLGTPLPMKKVGDSVFNIGCQQAIKNKWVEMGKTQVSRKVNQAWTWLPRGVKFDPLNHEIIWHLLAKSGVSGFLPHPFIDEFIPTTVKDDGISYTHPQKLPGDSSNKSSDILDLALMCSGRLDCNIEFPHPHRGSKGPDLADPFLEDECSSRFEELARSTDDFN
ncbi:suppressor of gamma response 1 [Tanacetum coccineum]